MKIAVIGAGLIGRRHIELVEQAAECVLCGIVEPSQQALSGLDASGAPVFDELDDLLSATRPDGIIIATPNALHVPQALRCIEAGVPALIEKPVAVTVAEGRGLLAAEAEAGARLLVGHHRLYSPIMEKAIEIVADGRLGALVACHGSAMFRKPQSYFDAAEWRTRPGGGPVLINMIHEIASLRALMGEIASVQATASSDIRRFAVEDSVAMTFKFASGALGTFLLSDAAASTKSWEQTSGENRAYARDRDENCYTVFGTAGSLDIPTMRLTTYAEGVEPSWWSPFRTGVKAVERSDPLARQLDHFCAVIRGEAHPRVSVADGVRNLAVSDAILEAARTSARIDLD